jgi:hypothetical protein
MYRILMPLFFLLILALGTGAQNRLNVSLPWGKAESQLGLYQDGDYLRGPVFFSLDEKGTFYIADAYKARVAVFDTSRHFMEAVPLPAISPRTTFFTRTEDGSFAVCNDQQLSRWSAQGTQIGRSDLGLALPLGYYATAQSFIVWLGQGDGEACWVYSRDLSQKNSISMKTPHGAIAALKDDSGRFWLPRWKEQLALYRWQAALSSEARLTGWTPEGNSVWATAAAAGTTISWVDAKGGKVKEESLPMPTTAEKKTCFAFGPGLSLYWAFWNAQGFNIQTEAQRNP